MFSSNLFSTTSVKRKKLSFPFIFRFSIYLFINVSAPILNKSSHLKLSSYPSINSLHQSPILRTSSLLPSPSLLTVFQIQKMAKLTALFFTALFLCYMVAHATRPQPLFHKESSEKTQHMVGYIMTLYTAYYDTILFMFFSCGFYMGLFCCSQGVEAEHQHAEAVDDNCEGVSQDDCLMRRTLVAHLDYIYTQNHKPWNIFSPTLHSTCHIKSLTCLIYIRCWYWGLKFFESFIIWICLQEIVYLVEYYMEFKLIMFVQMCLWRASTLFYLDKWTSKSNCLCVLCSVKVVQTNESVIIFKSCVLRSVIPF